MLYTQICDTFDTSLRRVNFILMFFQEEVTSYLSLTQFNSYTNASLMHPTPAKLAENQITVCTQGLNIAYYEVNLFF